MNEETMTNFLKVVKYAARLLGYDVFCAVEGNGVGYVAYSNTGSEAITNLRKSWEKATGIDTK